MLSDECLAPLRGAGWRCVESAMFPGECIDFRCLSVRVPQRAQTIRNAGISAPVHMCNDLAAFRWFLKRAGPVRVWPR